MPEPSELSGRRLVDHVKRATGRHRDAHAAAQAAGRHHYPGEPGAAQGPAEAPLQPPGPQRG